MKSLMKISFFALLFVLAATTTLSGQEVEKPRTERKERAERPERPERTPAQMAARQTEKLTERLELTEQQAAKVQAVNEASAKQLQILRNTTQEARKKTAEDAKAIRTRQLEELKAILTPEQFAKMEADMAERKEKAKERRGGRRGGRKGKN